MNNQIRNTRHSLCSSKGSSVYFGQNNLQRRALSLSNNASLTLEAAVVVPLFLLFCAAVFSFLLLLFVQVHVQSAMGETARDIGKKTYLLEQAEEGLWEAVYRDADEADAQALSLLEAGINPSVIKLWLWNENDLKSRLDRSRVNQGAAGLYTFASSYDPDSRILDLVVQYDYNVLWIPGSFGTLRFVHRMYSRVWTGKPLKEQDGNQKEEAKQKVYVTENGSVYHLTTSCSYLDLSIQLVSLQSLSARRNAGGGKYYPCPECAAKGAAAHVYITDYGTCWHTTLGCSGLKRTILEKDLSEVGDMRVCSRCKQLMQEGHVH